MTMQFLGFCLFLWILLLATGEALETLQCLRLIERSSSGSLCGDKHELLRVGNKVQGRCCFHSALFGMDHNFKAIPELRVLCFFERNTTKLKVVSTQ